jgi:hypothetical protein
VATLTPLPIEAEFNAALAMVCPGAFAIEIDGERAVYDFSDYLMVDGEQQHHRHWFRFHYTEGFVPHENLASFPPISFIDWEDYGKLSSQLRYQASGDLIVHSQSFEFLAAAKSARDRDLYARRKTVRDLLTKEFGALVVSDRLPQYEFWNTACQSLVSVHVPGSWRHSLDRGQHQLLGLGVCTVSPDIWTSVLGKRLEPYQHYVPLRDDFSDLVSQITWCRNHRSECAAIGRRAKEFFLRQSTPGAIWRYISEQMHTRRHC